MYVECVLFVVLKFPCAPWTAQLLIWCWNFFTFGYNLGREFSHSLYKGLIQVIFFIPPGTHYQGRTEQCGRFCKTLTQNLCTQPAALGIEPQTFAVLVPTLPGEKLELVSSPLASWYQYIVMAAWTSNRYLCFYL